MVWYSPRSTDCLRSARCQNHSTVRFFQALITQLTTLNITATPKPRPLAQTAHRVIYHQGDDCVGQWSDVVSIPVAG